MRRTSRIASCLALVLASAAAVAAASPSQVRVAGDCFHEQFKPKGIIITCGDANASVEKLKWSSWTTTKAIGAGTYEVNSCNPSCAAGHLNHFAVGVTLSKPGSCKHQSHKVFKEMTLAYASKQAAKHNPKHFTLFCPT